MNGTYNYDLDGTGVHVYVIDSGIRTTHSQFGGRASVGADFVGDGWNGQDCLGHGTHVAGIIGGSTYGVARNVQLHSVRVFDCYAGTQFSWVLGAVDWVTGHRISPAVTNMSLVAQGSYEPLEAAIRRSIAAGITYTISSGNDGIDASNATPARVTQAITVGATDANDQRLWWSNYGPVVDVLAPGDNILSAMNGSDTDSRTASGTSMAAPHVAGVVAMYLQAQPLWTPAEASTQLAIDATANVVGNPGPGSPNRLLYSKIENAMLTVYISGSGTVTGANNISCSSTGGTCIEVMPIGTVVELTAYPDEWYMFYGWSGACTGGDCVLTMSPMTSVTANFGVHPDSCWALSGNSCGPDWPSHPCSAICGCYSGVVYC